MLTKSRAGDTLMKPWIIVPAAGVGSRMQADKPKQYLTVYGRPVLQWTVMRLMQVFTDAKIILPLADGDPWWPQLSTDLPGEVSTCLGGNDRAASVMQGLLAAQAQGAEASDWVFVHDAVRPCVPVEDLRALWREVTKSGRSALLGVPVVDSLRRVNHDNYLDAAQDRTNLWRVFTPQVFPLAVLQRALNAAVSQGVTVTDESEAVLRSGVPVATVLGSEQNIKITYPADLARAEAILKQQNTVLKT